MVQSLPWISCVLSSNTPLLRGPRNSTTIASCCHPEGAPKGTEGLKNGSCGQWLTPVQSTRQKRRGNGGQAQAVTAERGCRATGHGVWESSAGRLLVCKRGKTHTTYMQLRRNPRTSPRTQLYHTAYLTTIREAGREPVAQTRSISVRRTDATFEPRRSKTVGTLALGLVSAQEQKLTTTASLNPLLG